jgi:diguanylate cyclase (GGDEF)-like protein
VVGAIEQAAVPRPFRRDMMRGRATPSKGQVAATLGAVVLVALAPLLVATWAFGRSFQKAELDRTDLRLAATVRSARDDLASLSTQAAVWASRRAASPGMAQDLEHGDPGTTTTRRGPLRLRITAGALAAGVPNGAITSTVRVRRGTRLLGAIVGDVPVDAGLVELLARDAVPGTQLVFVRGDRVVAGAGRGTALAIAPGSGDARIAGARYRLDGFSVDPAGGLFLAALTPRAPLDAAVRRRQEWVLAAGLATIASALLLLVLGRGVRRIPWFTSARRQLHSLALVGDAFAATRDADALFPVILDSAVAATGAAGASLTWNGVQVEQVGEPPGRNAVTFPLRNASGSGELVLAAPAGRLRSSDRELVHSLVRQAEVALESAHLHELVQQQALTDELTDLANRRRFRGALQAEITRARRFGGSVGLVLLDLDDFKQINDRHGHQAGDRVLVGVGAALRQRVRDTDLAARIGGDEFAVLLPHTDLAGCVELAEDVRATIERASGWETTGRTSVTASVGVAVYPEAASEDALMAAADGALYAAKARGRNRVATARPEAAAARGERRVP